MDAYVGEIRLFAGTFAPLGWKFCDGQLLAIDQETEALFSLIGNIYGGDGRTTFALPDMRGRVPVHRGYYHDVGGAGGTEKVTLTAEHLPSHTHTLAASTAAATKTHPEDNLPGNDTALPIYLEDPPGEAMNAEAISQAGAGQPHDNVQPFLCLNFIIAIQGEYPTRS